ncbi:Na+/H+ antiporter subunit E [Paracoccus sp. (in: a-proteobacteria)]|uniref:Na+/H+ antiporter subunit E n=1 Tax=Paracoccus sp. TaxID=267 RepID=UPI0028A298DA|nr:Na+/H+ antiporter subunit E [Paracoccus sp. (in: a-proteobacteria)]
MARYFPHPVLFVALVLMWMILTSFSLGHMLLGSAISMASGLVVSRLRPKRVQIKSWQAVVKLGVIVGVDILKSNIAVARIILRGPDDPDRHPGFIEVKLRLRDRNALALLSVIVTSTPGTAWIEHNPEDGMLLMHILDLREGEDWQKIISERYEGLLLEIFE